jgi:hypothetical protein
MSPLFDMLQLLWDLCMSILSLETQKAFALQQYVKAIGFITIPLREKGKQPADVALMTCVLFVCFEVSNSPISAR